MGYLSIGNYTKKHLMICFEGGFVGALFQMPKI
jgi:hypothetical protein